MDHIARIADALERIATAMEAEPQAGKSLTVRQVAKLLSASQETVRGWIRSGELRAADLASGPRPRWAIEPEAVEDFKRSRSGQSPSKPMKIRRLATKSSRF